MLGPPKRRSVGQRITVSLEQLVPADHFYRHLDATLDLSFVREWVQGCCRAAVGSQCRLGYATPPWYAGYMSLRAVR